MSSGYLDSLLESNAVLRSKVHHRTVQVGYELDRLRALRAELVLNATPACKKTSRLDGVSHALAPTTLERRKAERSPAYVAALKSAVQRQRAAGAASELTRSDWDSVAASLCGPEGKPPTSYEIASIYRDVSCSRADFTAAEVTLICQLVREHGYKWPAVCVTLRQRFPHERRPFDVAQQYRLCLRCVFRQARLSPSQLRELLDSDALTAEYRDYDKLAVEANRFLTNTALQVDPKALQREMEPLVFARFVPARHHLYWKTLNLTSHVPLWHPYRLDAFHQKVSLCYQQLSLNELLSSFNCTLAELNKKVEQHLLDRSQPLEKLHLDECSKKLFGSAGAAKYILKVAEELHSRQR